MSKIKEALDKDLFLTNYSIDDWLDYRSEVMQEKKQSNQIGMELILTRELKAIDDCISTIQKINRKKKA